MDVTLIVALAYIAACAVLHLALAAAWKRKKFKFRAPRSRAVFYFLSFTWGLPVVLAGCAAAGLLFLAGKRPKRYGWDFCFDKKVDWGLDMGLFFVADAAGSRRLLDHEHGHTIQNIWLGPFMPLTVCLPSVSRFWVRRIAQRAGGRLKTGYDDVWFEGSATLSGRALTDRVGGFADGPETDAERERTTKEAAEAAGRRKMNCKAAIFDMDGTLIDSMGVWSRIDESFLSKRGIEVPADYAESICALGFRGTAEYTVKRFGLPDTPEDLMAEWSAMADDEYAHRIELFPGAKEKLEELRSLGIRLFIATALTEKMYLPCLRNNGVDGFFEEVFAVDEVGMSKSDPEFFRHFCEKTGLLPGECVLFDDAAAAIAAAREAGFVCCAIGKSKPDGIPLGLESVGEIDPDRLFV
ncbi:MAG: HAD family phosphatase [Clostridia bacterium]|nr:HAD family phosphatase [Clostridia bacterium]